MGLPHADGSITWAAGWQIVVPHALVTLFVPYITVDKDGCPWICGIWRYYTGIPPYSWTRLVYKSSTNDGTWSTAGGFPYDLGPDTGSPPSGQFGDYWGVAAAPSNSTSDVLIVYTARGAALKGRIYSGSMGGEMTISSSAIIYACEFSVIGLDNKYHVAFERPTDYYLMDTYYNGTSWVESTVQSTFYSAVGYRAPVLSFNYTSSPWQVMLAWIEDNATYWQIKYKTWVSGTGWDASPSVFCVDNYYGMQYYTLSAFYANYGGKIGVHFASYVTPTYLHYSYINWTGYTEPPPPPPGSVITAFNITNMNAGNWLFAEERYYDFVITVNSTNMTYLLAPIDTIQINFTDGAAHAIVACARVAANSSIISVGTDYSTTAAGLITALQSADNATITMKVMLRLNIIDCFYVDFYAKINNTAADESDWALVASDYCNIYSRGGLCEDVFTGNAGRIAGGEVFELYTTMYAPGGEVAYAKSSQYWRNLQHVKMQFSVVLHEKNSLYEPDPILYLEYAMQVHDGTGWYTPLTVRMDYVNSSFTHPNVGSYSTIWLNYFVIFIDGTGTIFKNETIYTYLTVPIVSAGVEVKLEWELFLDIWFNRMNGSSVIAGRINSYYFPMKDDAAWWQRFWLGGTWGVDDTKPKESAGAATMYRPDGSVIYSKDVELMRLVCAMNASYPTGMAQKTVSVKNYRTFDLTITTRNMEGIQTPTFDETKMATFSTSSFFGSVWSALAGVLSGIVTALAPALAFISSAAVGLIDSLLQTLTGQSGVFSAFLAAVSAAISSAVSFMTVIASNIVTVATTIVSTVTWFLGTFFDSIWGILNFVFLTPTFNIITAFGTILGVSYAWLAGTTYTNGWGQVFDFTYLSTMHIGGLTGGICIFFLLFVVGFFLTILSCFAKMSLDPIAVPVRLVWRMVLSMIQIMTFVWHISVSLIQLLVQTAHAIRDLLPRPFGF